MPYTVVRNEEITALSNEFEVKDELHSAGLSRLGFYV